MAKIKNNLNVSFDKIGIYAYQVVKGTQLSAAVNDIITFDSTCLGIRNNESTSIILNLIPINNDETNPILITIPAGAVFNEIAFNGFKVSGSSNYNLPSVLFYLF